MLQLIIFEAGTFLDRQIIIMSCIFTKYNSRSDIILYKMQSTSICCLIFLYHIKKYLLFDISISYPFGLWYYI